MNLKAKLRVIQAKFGSLAQAAHRTIKKKSKEKRPKNPDKLFCHINRCNLWYLLTDFLLPNVKLHLNQVNIMKEKTHHKDQCSSCSLNAHFTYCQTDINDWHLNYTNKAACTGPTAAVLRFFPVHVFLYTDVFCCPGRLLSNPSICQTNTVLW